MIRDDGTVAGLREALHGALRGGDRPTCLLVAEADAVLAVAGMVREAGMRVPEDVSLVVRDHEPFLNRSVPEFSRYQFDWERFGRAVVQLLESVMGGVRTGGAGAAGWTRVFETVLLRCASGDERHDVALEELVARDSLLGQRLWAGVLSGEDDAGVVLVEERVVEMVEAV